MAAAPPALQPWRHPVDAIQARFRRWLHERLTPRDVMLLTQRNVYILPTRPGLMLAATLLLLLVASINYQLNLGYLLTFLLAGSALVGMHLCHAGLRGLTLQLLPVEPGFMGTSIALAVDLVSTRKRVRHGIGMCLQDGDHWTWTDVPAQGRATVHVAFKPARRGLHPVPALTAETRFPLGTFRVWTVWRPASSVLVYPAPEPAAPPLPPGEPRADGPSSAQARQARGDFDGVRAYRRGDPLKLVVWKKLAKAGEMVSRDTQQAQQHVLWLDLAHTGLPLPGGGGAAQERALSRLCAWVLLADRLGVDYGLRLGAQEIRPGTGSAHKRNCLEALARHGAAP